MCRPATSIRSASARAASGGMPNLEPAWPVRMCSWVSASTPGTTRRSSRGPPPSAWRRSASCSLSSTTVPTPASTAIRSSASDLALPCRYRRPGSNPARSARCSSPPEATSQPEPLLGEDAQDGRAREGLRREDDLAGAVVHPRQRVHERTRPGAQVVLAHHVGRGAELPSELAGVAAADAQHAVRDGGGLGIHGRGGYLRPGAHGPCGRRRLRAAAQDDQPGRARDHHDRRRRSAAG